MTAHERTGWRDEEISNRHREWGFNWVPLLHEASNRVARPAVDLDFLVVEYNRGLPVALIEYKHYRAMKPNLNHATYRAINEMARLSDLPFLIAFYWPDCWAFRVTPVNDLARRVYRPETTLTERLFVESLYHLRNIKIEERVFNSLRDELPAELMVAA